MYKLPRCRVKVNKKNVCVLYFLFNYENKIKLKEHLTNFWGFAIIFVAVPTSPTQWFICILQLAKGMQPKFVTTHIKDMNDFVVLNMNRNSEGVVNRF